MSLLNILLQSKTAVTTVYTHELHVGLLTPLCQIIRGKKPRWVPKAKSKMFYVRTPTPIDPKEQEELKLRYAHYRTQLRAVKRFLSESLREDKKQKKVDEDVEQKEQDDIEWMIKENDKWNQHSAQFREARLVKEIEGKEFKMRAKTDQELNKKLSMIEKAQKQLQKEMDEAGSQITLDNLDIEIEKLLNQRKDYNFAIDAFGHTLSNQEKKASSETDSTTSEKTSET